MALKAAQELFKPELVTDLINKVQGKSSVAILSNQTPVPFNGTEQFVFSMDKEVDIVAENAAKSEGGISLDSVKIVPIKLEYGARVSDEFLFASEEARVEVLKTFNEGFAMKVARGIDLMIFHGVNPRTGLASTVIGDNHMDNKVTQTVQITPDDPDTSVETAVGLVQGSGGVVNGMAMAPTFATALAKMVDGSGKRFPELAWGANPRSVNGLPTDVNETVSAVSSKDLAILGDYAGSMKWGYAKEIPFEVIKYGDPDNSGKDLRGYNQVYLRSEIFVGWGILAPEKFARIIEAEA